MPRIAEESIDEVRAGADLVELIRGRVDLVRRGGRWWGRCPFHDERTPSFSVIPPENRTYYCHGCGASGDAIRWMQEQEGAAGFVEAIEALADRFSIPLRYEEESPAEQAARAAAARRRELLERAATFYAEYLWRADEAAPAREHLAARGFDEEIARRFRVGYAPSSGTALSARAMRQGFSPELLGETGLGRPRGRTATDFFVARIMFPIADLRGRIQGFGGRTLDPTERAKYVNSPEGDHFRKRHLLFGLHLARPAATRQGWIVVAEGYTDVMALAAVGVDAAVACMGTSLTADQLRLIARTVGAGADVRLCFDGDEAGTRAAWRTVEAADGVPVRLSAVQLPSGQDPGDLLVRTGGRDELVRVVTGSEPLVTSLIRSRASRAGGSARERDRAVEEISALLRRFPDSVEKDEGVRLAAGLLQLSRSMEERLRSAARGEAHGAAEPGGDPAPRGVTPQERRERRFLALALADPRAAAELADELPDEAFEDARHRLAFHRLAEGLGGDDWPPELADLAIALRAELADTPAGPGELREALYRLQVPLLERRAAELRQAGDERGRLRVLDLLSRVRHALRGDA